MVHADAIVGNSQGLGFIIYGKNDGELLFPSTREGFVIAA
jgi:hypothetical protein